MKIGILGFPKTGKTTVFNALTGNDVATDKFAGRATKINQGVAKVRDERLAVLAKMYSPKKITPATVEYADVPGFEKGQGASNQYLAEFRGLDAILHVVRGFEDSELPHVFEGIDPARDIEAMEGELLLQDMAAVEARLERIETDRKKQKANPELEKERDTLLKMKAVLDSERPLRSEEWSDDVLAPVRGLALMTLKPLLHVINSGEEAIGTPLPTEIARFAERPRTGVTQLFGKVEYEISRLSEEDSRAFLADLGLTEPSADRVAAASYALLDLVSFLTAGEPEVRAWPIHRGTTARKAAGKIHSDIERGFIRAELVAFDDLVKAGSWAGARDKGTLRLEGKDYVFQDGDVVLFRFNV